MWLFAGGLAFVVAMVNLALVFNGKHQYCSILVLTSLSSGLFAMLSEYGLINEWVQAGDMSALKDVVPTMHNVLIVAVCFGIILNAVAVYANYNKSKK